MGQVIIMQRKAFGGGLLPAPRLCSFSSESRTSQAKGYFYDLVYSGLRCEEIPGWGGDVAQETLSEFTVSLRQILGCSFPEFWFWAECLTNPAIHTLPKHLASY